MPTLVGIFDLPGNTADVARKLRKRGFGQIEVYAPVPTEELDDALDEKPSRVRIFTLIGGLAGVVTGYALTIWMANDWQLIVGGKPFSSIPPYTIIAFELTILFGGLMTLLGLLAVGRLPRVKLDDEYCARFSAEEFGLAVACRDRDVAEVEEMMRAHGAKEVSLVGS